MKNTVGSINLNISKVFQVLFLSALLFQIGFGHVLAVNLEPNKSTNGATVQNSAAISDAEESKLKPTEYQNFNQFQNTEFNRVETKKGFFVRIKDKTFRSLGYAKNSLANSVKELKSFFVQVKNKAFPNKYFNLGLSGTALLSGWFLVNKSSGDWLASKVNSFFGKSKLFVNLKTKLIGFIKIMLSDIKQSAWNASKYLVNAFIPFGIPYINQYLLGPTRTWRESTALQLTQALGNLKNTTILPYIQEKTKGKGKTIAAFGVGATFVASVAIGLLQAGPEVTSVIMTPEKAISNTLALTGKISNASKDYAFSRVADPKLFIKDIQSIPEKRRQADQHLSQKLQDFQDTSSQNQADNLGNLTAQVVSLVAGSHGANKVSKVESVSDVISLTKKTDEYVNLASQVRTEHILTSHKFDSLLKNKSLFPRSWSDKQIMHNVSEVATDPNLKWIQQTGIPGATYTKSGFPVRYYVDGLKDGEKIRVVIEPNGEGIITAFIIQ